jgi:hypothetical protein
MLREKGAKLVSSSSVGNRPRGIKKQRPIRKIARLQAQTVSKASHVKRIEAIRSPTSNASVSRKARSSITSWRHVMLT